MPRSTDSGSDARLANSKAITSSAQVARTAGCNVGATFVIAGANQIRAPPRSTVSGRNSSQTTSEAPT